MKRKLSEYTETHYHSAEENEPDRQIKGSNSCKRRKVDPNKDTNTCTTNCKRKQDEYKKIIQYHTHHHTYINNYQLGKQALSQEKSPKNRKTKTDKLAPRLIKTETEKLAPRLIKSKTARVNESSNIETSFEKLSSTEPVRIRNEESYPTRTDNLIMSSIRVHINKDHPAMREKAKIEPIPRRSRNIYPEEEKDPADKRGPFEKHLAEVREQIWRKDLQEELKLARERFDSITEAQVVRSNAEQQTRERMLSGYMRRTYVDYLRSKR